MVFVSGQFEKFSAVGLIYAANTLSAEICTSTATCRLLTEITTLAA